MIQWRVWWIIMCVAWCDFSLWTYEWRTSGMSGRSSYIHNLSAFRYLQVTLICNMNGYKQMSVSFCWGRQSEQDKTMEINDTRSYANTSDDMTQHSPNKSVTQKHMKVGRLSVICRQLVSRGSGAIVTVGSLLCSAIKPEPSEHDAESRPLEEGHHRVDIYPNRHHWQFYSPT